MVNILEARNKNKKKFKKRQERPWDFDISADKENEIKEEKTENLNVFNINKDTDIEKKIEPAKNIEKKVIEPKKTVIKKPIIYTDSLYTLKEMILMYLSENLSSENTLITKPIFISDLTTNCGSTISSVKKTLQRLEINGAIERVKSKSGQGGCTVYKIIREEYEKIKEFKKIASS